MRPLDPALANAHAADPRQLALAPYGDIRQLIIWPFRDTLSEKPLHITIMPHHQIANWHYPMRGGEGGEKNQKMAWRRSQAQISAISARALLVGSRSCTASASAWA